MNKNLFSRTAAASFLLGFAMATLAQETHFLSSNHCIYRVDNSQKVLLLPVQEKAEMCNIKVVDGNNQVKALNVRLASNHIDYYVPLYLDAFKDSKGLSLDIHVNGSYRNDGELSGFTCWKNIKYADAFDMTNREQYRPVYHHTPAYAVRIYTIICRYKLYIPAAAAADAFIPVAAHSKIGFIDNELYPVIFDTLHFINRIIR